MVGILDAALIIYKAAWDGGLRQLAHGLGPVMIPFYIALLVVWGTFLVLIPDAIKSPKSANWKRILYLGILAVIPLLL